MVLKEYKGKACSCKLLRAQQTVKGFLHVIAVLLQSSDSLGPAETHTAKLFDGINIIIDGRGSRARRLLNSR